MASPRSFNTFTFRGQAPAGFGVANQIVASYQYPIGIDVLGFCLSSSCFNNSVLTEAVVTAFVGDFGGQGATFSVTGPGGIQGILASHEYPPSGFNPAGAPTVPNPLFGQTNIIMFPDNHLLRVPFGTPFNLAMNQGPDNFGINIFKVTLTVYFHIEQTHLQGQH